MPVVSMIFRSAVIRSDYRLGHPIQVLHLDRILSRKFTCIPPKVCDTTFVARFRVSFLRVFDKKTMFLVIYALRNLFSTH